MLRNKWLWCIVAAGFALKAPFFTAPLLGHFGSYQVINGMMGKMMLERGPAGWLMPQTYLVQGGDAALHLLYYPFGAAAAAVLNLVAGGDFDAWARIQAAVFAALSGFLLYGVSFRRIGTGAALTAVFFLTFHPMMMVYGIALQNEAVAVFFLLLAFSLLQRINPVLCFLSGLVFSLAIVARFHFLLLIPAFALWIWLSERRPGRVLLFLTGCMIPAAAWFGWTYVVQQQYPDRVMTSFFMQMGEGRILMTDLLKDQNFWSRLMDIIVLDWATPVLLTLVLVAVFKKDRFSLLMTLWALSAAFAVILIPQKVHDHPFYLISGVPAFAVMAASAMDSLNLRRSVRALLLSAFFIISMRGFLPAALSAVSPEARYIENLGLKVRNATEPGEKIIAQYGVSPELLYYTGRMGWSFDLDMDIRRFKPSESNLAKYLEWKKEGYGDLARWTEKLRSEGAVYFVIGEKDKLEAKKDFAAYLLSTYPAPATDESKKWIVFDLSGKAS